MCLAQRHIKRLLAFSTISHMGILLIAVGLDEPAGPRRRGHLHRRARAGQGLPFLLAGILLHCRGSVDEHELRGAGRRLPITGIAFCLAALGLAGIPPFGTGLGKSLIEEASRQVGRGWIAIALIAAASMTAGAALGVAGRVFLGWGPRTDPELEARAETRIVKPASGAVAHRGSCWGLLPCSSWQPVFADSSRRCSLASKRPLVASPMREITRRLYWMGPRVGQSSLKGLQLVTGPVSSRLS